MTRLLALLLCSYVAAAYADENVGRLFFTPAERADLERTRSNHPLERSPSAAETADTQSQPILSFNGFIRRNDGKNTIWINKQPIQEGNRIESVNVGKLHSNRDKASLELPGNRKIILAPGQRYENGQILTVVPVSRSSQP